MLVEPGPLLSQISTPDDLKKLTKDELNQICFELRQYIIDNVSVYGGHFGASLGVVELTVALHYVFDTPNDLLVWDVGHQAYGHKILTGRKNDFHTNRKYKGISGFQNVAKVLRCIWSRTFIYIYFCCFGNGSGIKLSKRQKQATYCCNRRWCYDSRNGI